MLFSHVKISSFCAKAHLVFHWCLYNNLLWYNSFNISLLLSLLWELVFPLIFSTSYTNYLHLAFAAWLSAIKQLIFHFMRCSRLYHVLVRTSRLEPAMVSDIKIAKFSWLMQLWCNLQEIAGSNYTGSRTSNKQIFD